LTSLIVGKDGTACQERSAVTPPQIAAVVVWSSSCRPGPVKVAPTTVPAVVVDHQLAGATDAVALSVHAGNPARRGSDRRDAQPGGSRRRGRSASARLRVVESFPLTEDGCDGAWQSLVGQVLTTHG
jgi:hypothetical protein